ncbi:HTH lacI-type domain-containing protein [Edwardsiella anguillarum]|uniref:LacI family DNA-binding transcriptional regulator n=1 Tax=Edwardsiella TaxID=635 RepID=UPI00045D405A|nr:LacI family DNA-binding transcriptional regulator [Edwardsiella anguillarum]AKM48335.1 hypothetical protein QY76_14440 [Edwardsiella sp. EA181011]GAJ66440.1 hypothetical protein MA13_contig00002-0143 [Edwardsiella piscicida]RFT01952.1 transcriptional regulator [Edwardsiella anguillarum]BET80373.1 HTH lacI-type domain-containing protein [Edwardsiella anguillarum]BET83662.1 HTH lacI-type domain-containing protein [Edwardsiella anguillarum]
MRYKVRNIRLQDVADKAGVSLMTASRVISNPNLVAEKTRKHVEVIIAELGYIKNDMASYLASSKNIFCFIIVESRLKKTDFSIYIERVLDCGMIPCVFFFESVAELSANVLRAKAISSPEMFVLFSTSCIDANDILTQLKIINLVDEG